MLDCGIKNGTRAVLLFGLGIVSAAAASPLGKPDLPGHVAFIRGDAAWIGTANGGNVRQLPGSRGVEMLSVAPRGGSAILFTDQGGKHEEDTITTGMLIRLPSGTMKVLPPPLDRADAVSVVWMPDGAGAYVVGQEPGRPVSDLEAKRNAETEDLLRWHGKWFEARGFAGFYSATSNTFHFENPVPQSISADGRFSAWGFDEKGQTARWSAGKGIAVRDARSGKVEKLFSSGKPAAMMAALKEARHAGKIEALTSREYEGDHAWSISRPAVAPDGQSLYFSSNAGTGIGAPGGMDFCVFSINLASRKLSVLSALGSFSGREPEALEVSPDGQHLLMVSVAHGSAIENPRQEIVIDLRTQRWRDLLRLGKNPRGNANVTAGPPCWSPDSRFVALDAAFYETERRDGRIRPWVPGHGPGRVVDTDWSPEDKDHSVLIYDAFTGRLLREIPGATYVSWTR